MIKVTDIHWLAGLLEGEGCFYLEKRRHPGISLQMGDEDIVVRAAALMKSKVNHYRNMWTTRVYGTYAIQWMMILYSCLGERRKEMITRVIQVWKENTYSAQRGMNPMATCHPDRPFYAFGLCSVCYQKRRHEKKQLLRKVG